MRKATLQIVGTMPLLMHADNIDWADKMEEWKNDPGNRAKSKAGDDRTPPWRWIGYLNSDHPTKGVVTIPSEYIMRCIMAGASEIIMKARKTFKEVSQSGILSEAYHWPLLINGKPIAMADINDVKTLASFKENAEAAEILGFSLFVKRAGIGMAKHIRVRPRFDNWSLNGELLITNDLITDAVLRQILEIAGRLKGLGDWRPSSKTPGPFGTFEAKVL